MVTAQILNFNFNGEDEKSLARGKKLMFSCKQSQFDSKILSKEKLLLLQINSIAEIEISISFDCAKMKHSPLEPQSDFCLHSSRLRLFRV